MKSLQYLAVILVISSASAKLDYWCDPNMCLYDCCTVKSSTVNDTCFTPTDPLTFNSTNDCPGRNSATATCKSDDCTTCGCFGEACSTTDWCAAAAGFMAAGLTCCLCALCAVVVPIVLIIVLIYMCNKKDRGHNYPPPHMQQ